MKSKNIFTIIIILLITLSSLSIAFASDVDYLTIKGCCFSTGSGLSDKTYATIYVGDEYAYEDIVVQIFYSRDGDKLNTGNMVEKTVDSNGYIKISSADAYSYYPDTSEVNIYDLNHDLLDSETYFLSTHSGKQIFGTGDFDDSSISSSSYSSSSSSSYSGSSYVGNKNTHKFHSSGCGDINKMKDSNKVYFTSRDEAINSGYKPCGHCNP